MLTFREKLPRAMGWFLLATAITFTLFSITMALWAAGDVPQWASVGLFGALTAALYLAAAHIFRYERTLTIERPRRALTERRRTVFGVAHREWNGEAFREVLAACTVVGEDVIDEAWLMPAAAGAQAIHLRRTRPNSAQDRALGETLADWLELPIRNQARS